VLPNNFSLAHTACYDAYLNYFSKLIEEEEKSREDFFVEKFKSLKKVKTKKLRS